MTSQRTHVLFLVFLILLMLPAAQAAILWESDWRTATGNDMTTALRDGVQVYTAQRSGPLGTNTQALHLGAATGSSLFQGVIDDVRIFNRALMIEEVQQMRDTAVN